MADLASKTTSHRREHSEGKFLSMVITYEGQISMARVWENKPFGAVVHETSLFTGEDAADFAAGCAADWVLYESDKK
jgi:hypothetical protein